MSLKYNILSEKKTKGIIQKKIGIVKDGNKKIQMKEVKELCKQFDKDVNGASYIILGRNDYKDHTTIRSYDGRFIDEIVDYYDNAGYDKDKFENFYRLEIIITKNN